MKYAIAILLLLTAACTSARTIAVTGCEGERLPMLFLNLPDRVPSATAALILTGDGGWRKIDSDISQVLRGRGIPVAGFLSNRYFAQLRTREEMTCDLRAAMKAIETHTHAARLLLIGFSRGADTLAVAAPMLSKEERARVPLVAILAPARTASLRVDRWWRRDAAPFAIDPAPLAAAVPVLCVYGASDRDSLCPSLPAPARIVARPGGHHFDGNYKAIAESIIEHLPPLP